MSMTDPITALRGARTMTRIEEINCAFLKAWGDGAVADEDAQRINDAVTEARQRVKDAPARRAPASARPRREKTFGVGRAIPLDRNAKARIMHRARAMSHRKVKGKAYGVITAKALAVLQALLWQFHNAKSGICFPSLEKIAEAANCARSTAAKALTALEEAGVLTWQNRIARVRQRCRDLFGNDGSRLRIVRTTNAYVFADPDKATAPPPASKSDFQSGTYNQASFSFPGTARKPPLGAREERERTPTWQLASA